MSGTIIDIEDDLAADCRYVDALLARSLRNGRCARILRNLMVINAAGIPQVSDGRAHLFEPEAICRVIRVLESFPETDLTKGPFRYDHGPLTGLYKKHFFQPAFLAENILKELEKEGPGIVYRKLSAHYGRGNYEGKPITEDDIAMIAEAFARDTTARRAARRTRTVHGGLTGEHLLYARTSAGNVYLYASFHGEDVQRIVECVRGSLPEFPDLAGTAATFSD